MPHLAERKEKNCLNRGTVVIGKYCHVCGQENIEPKESIWHLLSHFFNDVTHFDGKFFTSLKDLIFKPGFLSLQYVKGKRASYFNPIRMYLFTSFIFFLVFFSVYKVDENSFKLSAATQNNLSQIDSADLKNLSVAINNGKPLTKEELVKKVDSGSFTLMKSPIQTRAQLDSVMKHDPKKYNWLEKKYIYKKVQLNEKYKNNGRLAFIDTVEKVQHSIPQMLFILLPLFALMLQLLYVRHKNFFYTDHAIVTIHFYVFIFIAMLLIFGISKINAITGAAWSHYVNIILILSLFFYLYKVMRNFYKQGRFKTVLKFLILIVSFSVAGFFLLTIFFAISIFEI